MSEQIRWVGISGKLEKEPFNEWLLNAVEELLPENVELEIRDISEIPSFDEQFIPGVRANPPEVEELKSALDRAEIMRLPMV